MLSARERERLEFDLALAEWRADGGDGSVCSTHEVEAVVCLELEWLLHGALIEAMAAIVQLAGEARSIGTVESENSSRVAE